MSRPVRQFVLDLGSRTAYGAEDFLVADCNAEAVGWIERWPDWPAPALVLYGPEGAGKTHLARLFAARAGATVTSAADIALADPPRLVAVPAVVVEDADRGGGEQALLHLVNLARETGRTLLITGRQPPARWGVALPDLRSRLLAMPSVGIGAPDDDLLAALLVKLFADRQLRVPQEAVAYLLARIERSFAAARRVVGRIDALALAERRPVTVALLRHVLEEDAP